MAISDIRTARATALATITGLNVTATANIASFTNVAAFNLDQPDNWGMIPQWAFGTSSTVAPAIIGVAIRNEKWAASS